jgi:hypothetical protein
MWQGTALAQNTNLEYHNVYSELGLPTLSPASECNPPGTIVGWGHTRLRVRGWGILNSCDWRKSLALCIQYFVELGGGGG